MKRNRYVDVAVIGGGPAGLAAALGAHSTGKQVLLIEREARLGGILKQCIHDGFGLLEFGEKLSGPEYAHRFEKLVRDAAIEVDVQTFVSAITKTPEGFELMLVGTEGIHHVLAGALVLATGCRERTARQVAIHGSRPAGVLTAGAAQYYTNILGLLPARRVVVLGSGDIGMIMARRLTLEGAEVLGVYEAKQTPSGLSRNIAQCLQDFDIPLHLGQTVTRVLGQQRVEGVEIAHVDEAMRVIPGTEYVVACDGLVLSVGLIPENELAESLLVPLSPQTKGPVCDQNYMTLVEGVFSCGNALQVNDLADYVSDSGRAAGLAAARFGGESRVFAKVQPSQDFLSLTPQLLDINHMEKQATLYFRTKEERGRTRVCATLNGVAVYTKKYTQLRPPEMEKITMNLEGLSLQADSEIRFGMEALT